MRGVAVELRLAGEGFGLGFGGFVSLTSSSMYLPPPPGPPGTYLRFLRGGPSMGAGSELRDPFREAFGVFFRGRAGEERCLGEAYGAISTVHVV